MKINLRPAVAFVAIAGLSTIGSVANAQPSTPPNTTVPTLTTIDSSVTPASTSSPTPTVRAAQNTVDCTALTVLVPVPAGVDSELPTQTPSGIFGEAVGAALAREDSKEHITPIYIPYKAKGNGESGKVYSQTLTDGYARLTQVAHRVVTQCPNTKLAVLGQGQAGHLASFFASEVGKGKAAVKDKNIAFAATISDPTRAEGQPLFPGAPGLSAPESWGKASANPVKNSTKSTTSEPATSISLFADLATVPAGAGIKPEMQRISDFGSLKGRVAQFCVEGDLSCSAPVNAALGRAAMAINEQSGADFSRDPLSAANLTAQAFSATAATGVAKHAAKDWKGDTLASISPTGEHSVSQRLEQAASPEIRSSMSTRNSAKDKETSVAEDSLEALARGGSIGVSAVTTVATDILDDDTIASLITAGITGGATSPIVGTTMAAKAGKSALKLVPPNSLGTRAKSIFTAATNDIKDNADLPELIASAKTWDVLTTQDGYRNVSISSEGKSVVDVLGDWTASAAKDLAEEEVSPTVSSSSSQPTAAASSPASKTTPTTSGRVSASINTTDTRAPLDAHADPVVPPAPSTRLVTNEKYIKTSDNKVMAAGEEVKPKDEEKYALHTVAAATKDYAGQRQNFAEASGKLITGGNEQFTAAQQLAYLADPGYPSDSAVKQIAVAGGLTPIVYAKPAVKNGK